MKKALLFLLVLLTGTANASAVTVYLKGSVYEKQNKAISYQGSEKKSETTKSSVFLGLGFDWMSIGVGNVTLQEVNGIADDVTLDVKVNPAEASVYISYFSLTYGMGEGDAVITDADGLEEEGKSTYESYGIGVFFDYIGIDYAISTISVDMSSSDDTYETESSDLSLIISVSF